MGDIKYIRSVLIDIGVIGVIIVDLIFVVVVVVVVVFTAVGGWSSSLW